MTIKQAEDAVYGDKRSSILPSSPVDTTSTQSVTDGQPVERVSDANTADWKKRLKAWSEDPEKGLCADFTTEGYAYYEELKAFIAAEREQVRRETIEEVMGLLVDEPVPDIRLTAEAAEIMGSLQSGSEGRNKFRQELRQQLEQMKGKNDRR